jgi:hypothetical protein
VCCKVLTTKTTVAQSDYGIKQTAEVIAEIRSGFEPALALVECHGGNPVNTDRCYRHGSQSDGELDLFVSTRSTSKPSPRRAQSWQRR